MDHAMTVLRDDIHVDGIFTLYYFEFGVNYHFPGERHDFWEMIYVDAGELTVNTESGFVPLRRGDAVFHPPGFFHTCRGNEREPVNLIVMTFSLGGPGDAPLEPLKNRAVHLNERHAVALTAIVREAKKAFSTPLGSYIGRELVRSPSPAYGSEQLIRLYLEWMLIDLLRESPAPPSFAVACTCTLLVWFHSARIRPVCQQKISACPAPSSFCPIDMPPFHRYNGAYAVHRPRLPGLPAHAADGIRFVGRRSKIERGTVRHLGRAALFDSAGSKAAVPARACRSGPYKNAYSERIGHNHGIS